jgi:hypothetical protein
VRRLNVLSDEFPLHHIQGSEFDEKLRVLKQNVVRSFKQEICLKSEQCSTEDDFINAAEINYDNFIDLLNKAKLPELGNRAVFNIFDTRNTGT